ncbi:MAG: adenosine deaminase [Planctomycetes bacterium]|nr:adenosine deaminase [Planctomycetota bacterium]
MPTGPLDPDLLRRLPKVSLHDHLDGSVRPATLIELASKCNYDGLPTTDADELGDWFFRGADRGSLALYLEGFTHTIALLQDAEALERVAYEYAEDLAADGVVYSEVRFAPLFHTQEGLGLDGVLAAVLRGLKRGKEDFRIESRVIVCALRSESAEISSRLADLTTSWLGRGVAGFDLAGEEAGHPPKDHLDAFHTIKRANGSITIHAGEGFGPESIWQALQYCGAHRIGHGTRLMEDMAIWEGKVIRLGRLARFVLDHRVPLEMCLSSNVHTGAVPDLASHPFPHFLREGFRVTINTDNRLMSGTTMTQEYLLAHQEYGLSLSELERLAVNGINAAFHDYWERRRILHERIAPGYAIAREELAELGMEAGPSLSHGDKEA